MYEPASEDGLRASIIIVAYNSRHDLERCLSSVLADIGTGDEVLVVDNGSTDGSADLVAVRFPTVRLIRSTNTGYAGGNNRGAQAANGEFLVFLNPDTEVEPGAIDALIAPLAAGQAGLTTACLVYMDRPDIINACGNSVHISGLAYCRGNGRARAAYNHAAEVAAVSGAAFALPRALFLALDGFDERFFMYVEDTDLSLRAHLVGQRCLYVPMAVVRHAYQPAFGPSKVYYVDRNRHLMLLKNLRSGTYLRLLPVLLLAEAMTWGFLLMRGPRYWLVKPKVYAWLWAQRQSIQTSRGHLAMRAPRIERELLQTFTRQLSAGDIASPALAAIATGAFRMMFTIACMLARLPGSAED